MSAEINKTDFDNAQDATPSWFVDGLTLQGPMNTISTEPSCGSCGVSPVIDPKRCSGCQSVRYCGERCRDQDWLKKHKFHCRLYTTRTKFPHTLDAEISSPFYVPYREVPVGNSGDNFKLEGEMQEIKNKRLGEFMKEHCSRHGKEARSLRSPLLDSLGVPLIVLCTTLETGLSNQLGVFLLTDPANGYAPGEYWNGLGDCWLARLDGVPITQTDAEFLWFAVDRLMDVFESGMGKGGPKNVLKFFRKEQETFNARMPEEKRTTIIPI